MLTDVDSFAAALASTGMPPLLSGRHEPRFHASVTVHDLGSVRLIESVTPAGECFRDARSVRPQDEELWQIDLMTRGRARVEQGTTSAELGPSDLVLTDPARQIGFTSTASTHLTLLVPRHELRLAPAEVARLAGVRIRGCHGPGGVVSEFVRGLARSGSEARGATVVELLSAALSAQLDDLRPRPDEALRECVLGYIEVRLAEEDLVPARIAAAHHISLRRLHTLFDDMPFTVAALIRRRRLERCRADLARGDRTVSAVASHWGFTDPAHFSRLFKSTFGVTAGVLSTGNRARKVNALSGRRDEDGSVQTSEG